MIKLVTDSSSQIPETLRARYDVEVVPIAVTVDGVEYREGVDLDADGFWELWREHTPEVSTSQPSPGEFAEVYRRLVTDGATEIVSVHVGSLFSGTLNSARLGAEHVDVPVHLVDTETLSFGVTCCLWAAAEAVAGGANGAAAAIAAKGVGAELGSVTILQALDFTRGQGRLVDALPDDADGVPVLVMRGADTEIVGEGRRLDELADLMVTVMTEGDTKRRVAVCIADASAQPFADAMTTRLQDHPCVVDLVHYRVGPSIGAFTGPGTAGGFWMPA